MKKLLFSGAFVASSLLFGQITLEKTFSNNESVTVIPNNKDFAYISTTKNNKLVLYNTDYSVKKTINVDIAIEQELHFSYDTYDRWSAVSKQIFNTDEKYEFIVEVRHNNNGQNKYLIIDEDGKIIKDLTTSDYSSYYYPTVYHDIVTNKNKLMITQTNLKNPTEYFEEVYLLPTTSLSIAEIETTSVLQAFPNPAQTTLNIVNPKNGINNIEIFDFNGRSIIKKDFNSTDNKISIDVQRLPQGTYIYKIGNSSAKFIKK